MSEHPIQGLMKTAMENLKEMIDVNTIIGDPVETPDGSVILTVSKVGFGFAAGGSEFGAQQQRNQSSQQSQQSSSSDSKEMPFGGGSGGGVSITPIAFLVVSNTGIKTIHLDNSTHLYERILDLAPGVIDKLQHLMNKNKPKDSSNTNQGTNKETHEF
ncbi:GerW family sporulation protein [Fictibacillus nanhaiensis]|uniref:GerW family sporulation protein n=1 Tax=Fictibacillus nanhaiensis TaxID=742169 RepID=UPI001C94A05C|nr:GerW family sporulation protein [Fictibacillus nanhaiensis]MBY6035184.1 GerW family sporulation protein [Fictibacillus nanhaiensis]